MKRIHSSTFLKISMFFFFLTFIFFNNCLWVIKNDFFQHPDSTKHIYYAGLFYSDLRSLTFEKGIVLKTLKDFLALFIPKEKNELYNPKLVYFFASIMAMIFGLSINTLDMSNIIYAVILVLSLYHIGKKVGNKNAGLFAGFITLMYPGIFAFSRYFSMDFPLTAMVVLNIYLLIRTENFKDMRYSVFFGLAFGLGMLIKLQIVFFLIGPLGYVLIKRMITKRKGLIQCLRNFLLAIGLTMLISSPQWFKNISAIYRLFAVHIWAPRGILPYHAEAEPYPFFLDWFIFYITRSIMCISPLFFIVFIFGSIIFFRSKIKERFLLLWWIIGGYLIFTIITVKSGRYYLPALPAFALISSFGILGLRNRWVRFLIVVFMIFLGINQWVGLSFGIQLFPTRYKKLILSPIRKIEKVFPFMWQWDPRYYAKEIGKNNHEEVIKTFIKEINLKERSKILIISKRDNSSKICSIQNLLIINRPDLLTDGIGLDSTGDEINEGEEFDIDYIIVIGDIPDLNKIKTERQKVHLIKTELLLPSQIEISFWSVKKGLNEDS